MKKGICLGSLPGDGLEAKLKLAKEAGFDGVEIGTLTNDEDRRRYREIADAVGIEIHSIMNSKHWAKPLSDPDPKVREESAQGVIDSIKTASVVGADTVLLVPAVVTENVTYEEAYERSQIEIRRLAKVAAAARIYIAVENVWNKFLLSPIEFARYVDEFESEYVVAYFDVGNIVLYGYPQHWIRTLGKRIKKIHVKGFHGQRREFTWLLEGTINWRAVMEALREVGYDGYLTAELPVDSKDPEGRVKMISEDLDKIISGEA
jgi:hexulose-6-phosphate isomerase